MTDSATGRNAASFLPAPGDGLKDRLPGAKVRVCKMVEHIFRSENDSHSLTRGIEDMCALMPNDWYGTLHEEIVRCRDCKWLWVYMGNSYCDCDYMERSCS